MTLRIVFRSLALTKFRDAADFYESKRPELGVEFVLEIERCISLASEKPLAYSVVHNGMGRIMTKRFPFAIYFRFQSEQVVFIVIFHSSRNPSVWRERY